MSLWTAQAPMQPPPDSQYSLPIPPHLAAPPALPLAVATLPTQLAPPPPASSLDAARLRLALDRIKLELDAGREALTEVLALKDAVDAVSEAVRLVTKERDVRERDLEVRIVAAVRIAVEEQLGPLRAAVTAATDQILSGLRECNSRAAEGEASVVREREAAARQAEQVERTLRAEIEHAGQRATALVDEQARAFDARIASAASADDVQEAALRRLERALAKVETRLDALAPQETTTAGSLVVGRENAGEVSAPGSWTALATTSVSVDHSGAYVAPPATSSSDAPGPSPPPHRMRRFVSELEAATPRQTASLPHVASPALLADDPAAASTLSTQRASTAPTPTNALPRSTTKRRVIEQDESQPQAANEDKEASEGAKRRRVIEQDATPLSTQGEEQGVAGAQREERSGIEEEGGELDTLE
ncbi:hypothetical protein JCM3770_001429 [Rhodotorula araucariae]